jgi:Mg-chelatase subunit ChlD
MPTPTNHTTTATRRPAPVDPDWAVWSTAWTKQVTVLSGRNDLSVNVAPGAAGDAPARLHRPTGRIDIDATHIGQPDITDPRRARHKTVVPAAYGLLVHEAAHAAHTHWNPTPSTPPVVIEVAMLLEESRIEHRQRQRRRYDRRFLRHAVNQLITADDAPVDNPWCAARVAGLLLARVDAGIITSKDTRTARAAVTRLLGRATLRQLRDIWRQAHTVADTDDATMTDLAWQWCRIIGINPHRNPEIPVPDAGMFTGILAAALIDYLATQAGLAPGEYRRGLVGRNFPTPATWTRRDPTPAEHHAARHLGHRLAAARTHHPEPTTQQSVTPPGRLRVRHAITAQAQQAAGTIPTAAPWQRRTHQPPPKPTLHLAVLVDVSGSMAGYAKAMSSAAWILAHAAHRNHAITTTIAFGSTVTLLIPPATRPAQVLEMRPRGGTDTFTAAVKLADQTLDLRNHRHLRMIAVVSDADLDDPDAAQKLITTLHRSGCVMLWLTPADQDCHRFTDTTTIDVADPLDAIRHIGDTAVRALRNA